MAKIGVVGIVITEKDKETIMSMQEVLGEFSDIIVGRMGIPRDEVNAIALIVEGTVERISALTGKLGKFKNISVKSALAATKE